MVSLGYKLCSEERTAAELVRDAIAAEEAGFELAAISDHYHPWMDAQGESSFVWAVLGAIAARTDTLRVGTAVTSPIQRIHLLWWRRPQPPPRSCSTAGSSWGSDLART
jgi:coenzyme F420-dependent glucose-6-phosphate dehydrogenase